MDAVSDELITHGGSLGFRLFGEIELRAAGRLLDIGTPRQQMVLAALLLDAGRPVAIETLIDRVWDESPPAKARTVLYSHLSRIRELFRQAATHTKTTAVRVERQRSGYILNHDPDLVDLHRFWRLVDQGHTTRHADVDRATMLTEALKLWRGPPLAALSGRWFTQVRNSWHRRRLDAIVQWAEVELRLGHPAVVITALPDLIAEYPLVEPLEGLLMRALHMSGRDAEALDRYTTIRQRLADDLGADPNSELRTLHQAILRGEPPPALLADQVIIPASKTPVPAQLPPDVYGFTGRDNELRHLDTTMTAATGQPTAMVISAISGTAGVGKTALAVHWAHQVASRFPDGQLYVNLRGYDPDQPLATIDALAAFLRSLGMNGAEIPEDQAERACLFRSVLANRRMLVLLDNAHSVEQVVDLLPGTFGCLTLVTSRDRLYGLGVSHGARRIDLGPLPPSDAAELLGTYIGARVQTEPDAVDTLIKQCAFLPLALRIAAQLATARPMESLTNVVKELTNEEQRLDLLDAGDPYSCIRTVFSWSYRHLPEPAARLFRLLGAHPGRELDVMTAAAMAGISVRQAQQSLNALSRAHLIQETANRRYGMHDLLYAYATELAHSHDEAPDLAGALTHLFDYYLHTAARAMDRFAPYDRHLVVTIPSLARSAQQFPDRNSAVAWLDTERANLVATGLYAANHGWPSYTCHLSDVLWRYFSRGYHNADAKTLCTEALRVTNDATRAGAVCRYGVVLWRSGYHQQALDHYEQALNIANKSGERTTEAAVLIDRGIACYWLKRYDEARTQLQLALTIAKDLNDLYLESHARDTLGQIYQAIGHYPEALDSQKQAICLYRQLDDPHSEAGVRGNLGVTYSRLGQYPEAIEHHQHALTTLRALGDRHGEAETLNDLATTLHDSGSHQQAINRYHQAITCAEAIRDRYEQIRAHDGLAHCHHALGDTDTADQHLYSMRALQTDLGE